MPYNAFRLRNGHGPFRGSKLSKNGTEREIQKCKKPRLIRPQDARCFCGNNISSLTLARISRGNYVPPRAPSSLRRGRSRKNSTETEPNSKAKKAEAALDSASCGWHKAIPRRARLPCTLSLSCRGYQGAQPHGVFWLLFDVEK